MCTHACTHTLTYTHIHRCTHLAFEFVDRLFEIVPLLLDFFILDLELLKFCLKTEGHHNCMFQLTMCVSLSTKRASCFSRQCVYLCPPEEHPVSADNVCISAHQNIMFQPTMCVSLSTKRASCFSRQCVYLCPPEHHVSADNVCISAHQKSIMFQPTMCVSLPTRRASCFSQQCVYLCPPEEHHVLADNVYLCPPEEHQACMLQPIRCVSRSRLRETLIA